MRGGGGGAGSGGDLNLEGQPGEMTTAGNVNKPSGMGGSMWGGGGISRQANEAGVAGTNGGGGSGAADEATSARAGAAGGDGFCIVMEYA